MSVFADGSPDRSDAIWCSALSNSALTINKRKCQSRVGRCMEKQSPALEIKQGGRDLGNAQGRTLVGNLFFCKPPRAPKARPAPGARRTKTSATKVSPRFAGVPSAWSSPASREAALPSPRTARVARAQMRNYFSSSRRNFARSRRAPGAEAFRVRAVSRNPPALDRFRR